MFQDTTLVTAFPKPSQPPLKNAGRFGNQWAIRKGDWKRCANRIDGVANPKLFDLTDDIGEANDLTAMHPDKLQELQADWTKWSSEQMKPRWVPQPRQPRAAR